MSRKTDLDATSDSKGNFPDLKTDGRMYVYLSGDYFQQNGVVIPNNNNVINIYSVYKLQSISSSRDSVFNIQNALFGAAQITKNSDTGRYNYKGYGICFDE